MRPAQCLLLFALSVLPAVADGAEPAYRGPLFRHRSIQEAWTQAVAQRKPLLVMFTTDHCAYCDKMLQGTYSNPQVERLLLARAETVLAHSRDYAELAKKLGVRGFPTSLVVSPAGEVLQVAPGYVEPRQFLAQFGPALTPRPAAVQAGYLAPPR